MSKCEKKMSRWVTLNVRDIFSATHKLNFIKSKISISAFQMESDKCKKT